MNSDLESFNYFVEDILDTNIDLLKYELDVLLMQYLFQSLDLENINIIGSERQTFVA